MDSGVAENCSSVLASCVTLSRTSLCSCIFCTPFSRSGHPWRRFCSRQNSTSYIPVVVSRHLCFLHIIHGGCAGMTKENGYRPCWNDEQLVHRNDESPPFIPIATKKALLKGFFCRRIDKHKDLFDETSGKVSC